MENKATRWVEHYHAFNCYQIHTETEELQKKTQLIAGGIAHTAGKDEKGNCKHIAERGQKKMRICTWGRKNGRHREARKVCIIEL
jgi:hypothetical protein